MAREGKVAWRCQRRWWGRRWRDQVKVTLSVMFLKFWSGRSPHLLLRNGSDSVIPMIGLNPGRVEKTE